VTVVSGALVLGSTLPHGRGRIANEDEAAHFCTEVTEPVLETVAAAGQTETIQSIRSDRLSTDSRLLVASPVSCLAERDLKCDPRPYFPHARTNH